MASPNNLVVRLTAVDLTSQAIDSVARKLAGITAPATKVTKSLARLSDATGVTKLSKAIAALGATAIRTGDNLAGSFAPFTALTSALSVAGVAKMTSDWARATQALSFDATRVGATIERLSALEGSAELAGSSAQAAASGIRSLQDTMTDTVGGRNMEALVYFRQLNVAFDDGRGHALRATEVMPKLADALSRISDRSIRARVGTALLGGAYEELAPWIDLGAKGMEEYTERARRHGVVTNANTKAAKEFRSAQADLELAMEGLGNAIFSRAAPALTSLMTTTTNWLDKNREMFALDVKKWGDDYAAAFGGVGSAIDKAVQSTIGWNTALEIGVPLIVSRMIPPIARLENVLLRLAAIQIPSWLVRLSGGGLASLAAPLLLSGDTPTAPLLNQPRTKPGFLGQGGTLENWIRGLFGGGRSSSAATGDLATGQRMMRFFEGQGWTHDQAAGITANLERESAFDSGRTGDNGQAYGIAQWHQDRQADFAKWAGHDIRGSTLDEQMRFVQWELTHSERGAGDLLKMAPNAATSAYVVNSRYERPADIPGENTIRGRGAERWAGLAADTSEPPLLDNSLRARLDRLSRGSERPADAPQADGAARAPWHFPWPHPRLEPSANQPSWIDRLDDGPLKRALQGSPEPSQAAPAPSRDPAPASSTHEIVVKIQTPPGTQATTTSTGTGPASVRVERAMQ